jgi:hypothetical protein
VPPFEAATVPDFFEQLFQSRHQPPRSAPGLQRAIMQNPSLRALGCAGMVAAAMSVPSAPARSAAVINGTHYMEYKHVLCDDKASCALPFAKVPVGKKLLVIRVTCKVVTGGATANLGTLTLAQASNANPPTLQGTEAHIAPEVVSVNGGIRVHVANNEMFYLFTAGQTPFILAKAPVGTINNANCTLFGTIENVVT